MTATKTAKTARTTRKPAGKFAAAKVAAARAQAHKSTTKAAADVKVEIPQAARDYAHRAAETALERAASLHVGAAKATLTLEKTAVSAVSEAARLSRDFQTALFDEAKAAIEAFEHVIAAKSLSEAARIQADFLRARADIAVARAKAASAVAAKVVHDGVKYAQDNVAKLSAKVGIAA